MPDAIIGAGTNLAVRVAWADGDPEALVRALKGIETELGRAPRARWAPREVNLDLLAFGDRSRTTADLTLPHPAL